MRTPSGLGSAIAIVWLAAVTVALGFALRVGQERIVIAAGPRAGDSFELASSIARVVGQRYPHMDIDVFETHGSTENVRLLEKGHADFASMQADVKSDGSVHAIASLYFDAYQLVAAESSDIHAPADLVGHSVAIGPRGSGHYEAFWSLIEHYGLDPADLVALPMSSEAAHFAMRHGQVDAIFRVHALGNQTLRGLTNELAVRLVPIDQASALALRHPAVTSGTIPRGSYRGAPPLPPSDQPTAMVERLLVARAGLDAAVVKDFTRALFEERSTLIADNALAGYIAAPDVEGKLALPVHEGARRYYDREKPSFWQKNTRVLAPSLYVVVIASSAFFALRARVKRRRRVRMSHLNFDLMDIAEEAARASKAEDLLPLRERLVNMLRGVVVDLDEERVSQNEFEHFSFAWSAVETLLRDRMDRVRGAGDPRGEAGQTRDG